MVKIPAMTMYFKNSVRLQEAMESARNQTIIGHGHLVCRLVKLINHALFLSVELDHTSPMKQFINLGIDLTSGVKRKSFMGLSVMRLYKD